MDKNINQNEELKKIAKKNLLLVAKITWDSIVLGGWFHKHPQERKGERNHEWERFSSPSGK